MTTHDIAKGTPVVEAVVRAFRLLDCFEPGEPELSLAESVRRGGYSKTTTYRLLTTLQHVGWLERTPEGGFRLTIKPVQLGAVLVDTLEVRQEAAPVMTELAAKWQHTVYLIAPSDEQAVCLERMNTGQAIRIMALDVGGSQPFHLGAGPRALLAFGPDERLERVLAQGLSRATPTSITDPDALRRDLAESRERGYVLSLGDMTPEVGAIAAPVFDRSGTAVAAISMAGLVERFRPPRDRDVAADLMEACRRVSARLGYRPLAPARGDAAA